jgi:hypothetical protein
VRDLTRVLQRDYVAARLLMTQGPSPTPENIADSTPSGTSDYEDEGPLPCADGGKLSQCELGCPGTLECSPRSRQVAIVALLLTDPVTVWEIG